MLASSVGYFSHSGSAKAATISTIYPRLANGHLLLPITDRSSSSSWRFFARQAPRDYSLHISWKGWVCLTEHGFCRQEKCTQTWRLLFYTGLP